MWVSREAAKSRRETVNTDPDFAFFAPSRESGDMDYPEIIRPPGEGFNKAEDWAKRLDRFLEFDDRKLLEDRGKVTKEMAKEFAESEFEKYRVVQDRLFESDFDRMLKEAAPVEEEERGNTKQ